MPVADHHDVIRVHGARANNLRQVSLEIPKRRLTVFTGVSGSGKSSLVLDTIAAESQRLVNETYSAFLQGYMGTPSRPDVDRLEGLTTAIVVGQDPMGANPRSTVGTASDLDAMLRVLFSRFASPRIGSPKAYSFNIPSVSGQGAVTLTTGDRRGHKEVRSFSVVGGMCPRCEGRGAISDIDLTQLYDPTRSLHDGALDLIPGYKGGGWNSRLYAESGLVDPDKPIGEFTRRELDALLYHEPTRMKIAGINMTYEGLVLRIRKSMLSKDPEAMQPHVRAFVDRAVTFGTCPECEGTRLTRAARDSRIDGVSIADASAMEVRHLATWVRALDLPDAAPLLAGLTETLDSLVEVGLGYLSLNRPSGSLSGGEAQRVKMVRHLGSALTDVTYVFDEPTVGLHPHDIARMNDLLLRLRDKGNTVLVVEHKPETIAIADHVVDLGPGAGVHGGTVTFEGTVDQLRASDTLTGRHLADRTRVKDVVRTGTGHLAVRDAAVHNLQHVDVDIPTGVLVVVTGVAGSGKSSLVEECLPASAEAVLIDQSQIKGSRRSNPATYTGLLEPIRKAFARANGVPASLFSPNSEGACPTCNGLGVVHTELGFMETFTSTCEVCQGRRFGQEVLDHHLGGVDIAQVLAMSAEEALGFFRTGEAKVPAAARILRRIVDAGLGYLPIGQPLSTLSGGERQRLKLADRMATPGGVLVLDEPTTGLHLADVEQLLGLLDHLVDEARSVIVVAHHLAVVAHADWVVDLGPGAGSDGGRIVFQGTPADLAVSGTTTGQHLAAYLA